MYSAFKGSQSRPTSHSTQTVEPWAPAIPGLKYTFKEGRDIYDQGQKLPKAPIYQGQLYAPGSRWGNFYRAVDQGTGQHIGDAFQRGQNQLGQLSAGVAASQFQSPVAGDAYGGAAHTIRGGFVGGNQDRVNRAVQLATQPLYENYSRTNSTNPNRKSTWNRQTRQY